MSIAGIFDAFKKEIKVWSASDLGVDAAEVGLESSPTNVYRSFTPLPKGKGIVIQADTPKEAAADLLRQLKNKHVI